MNFEPVPSTCSNEVVGLHPVGLHPYEKMAIEDAIIEVTGPDKKIERMVSGIERLPKQILMWGGLPKKVGSKRSCTVYYEGIEKFDFEFSNRLFPDNYRTKYGRDITADLEGFPLPTPFFELAATIWTTEVTRKNLSSRTIGIEYEFAVIERYLNKLKFYRNHKEARQRDIAKLENFYKQPQMRDSTKVGVVAFIICALFLACFFSFDSKDVSLLVLGIVSGGVACASLVWKVVKEDRPCRIHKRNPKLLMENPSK